MALHYTYVNVLEVARADDRRGDASPGLASTYGTELIWPVVGDVLATTSYDKPVRRSDTAAVCWSTQQ